MIRDRLIANNFLVSLVESAIEGIRQTAGVRELIRESGRERVEFDAVKTYLGIICNSDGSHNEREARIWIP